MLLALSDNVHLIKQNLASIASIHNDYIRSGELSFNNFSRLMLIFPEIEKSFKLLAKARASANEHIRTPNFISLKHGELQRNCRYSDIIKKIINAANFDKYERLVNAFRKSIDLDATITLILSTLAENGISVDNAMITRIEPPKKEVDAISLNETLSLYDADASEQIDEDGHLEIFLAEEDFKMPEFTVEDPLSIAIREYFENPSDIELYSGLEEFKPQEPPKKSRFKTKMEKEIENMYAKGYFESVIDDNMAQSIKEKAAYEEELEIPERVLRRLYGRMRVA